ncbi:TLD-domain-containing protein [Phycomyces nitens]|nr:TLD-domain-containing protein [Phycomyces nitens]
MKSQKLPLYRSVTEDKSPTENHSPLTRFVSKLLGFVRVPKRPRLEHKSHSTTSITKSSVISFQPRHYNQPSNSDALKAQICSDPNTLVSAIHCDTSLITTRTAYSSSLSSQTTDSAQSTGDEEEEEVDEEEEDLKSISSTSTNTSIPRSTSCPPSRRKPFSAAIGALVSASKIPAQPQPRLVHFDTFDMPPPTLVDRRPDTEPVMTGEIAEQLRPYLPRRYRLAPQWSLLYSLDQHGISLTTLYRLVKSNKGPCIITIKDADDQIFGAFLNETLTCGTSYYGTGECFLWKTTKQDSVQNKPMAPKIKVFPWTGKNEYMILSENDFIAIGGGDGKFGLWINADLEKGHSEECPTFDNECLSPSPEFECIELEIWGFRI